MHGSSDDWMAALAADDIRATLGVEPEPWDTGGRLGAHDLRYEQDGRRVAVEVKAVVHQNLRKMDDAIRRVGYLPATQLTRLWVVYLRAGADIRPARAGLPPLLAQLECRGWANLPPPSMIQSGALADQVSRLQVVSAYSHPATTAYPPGFALLLEQVWAWEEQIPDPATFVNGVLNDASVPMQKLRRQLRDADVDERHAFLLVGRQHTAAWPLMSAGGDLPTEQPHLPEPVDGVWVATFSAETRVVAWLPRLGWIERKRSKP
jgi:hypothetical protein